MLRQQTIFIDGLPPAVVQREHAWKTSDEGYTSAWSHVLVCPVCLRQWAFLHLTGDTEYVISSAYCEKHTPADYHWTDGVPGSVLLEIGFGSIDEPLLAVLPREMLLREFRLTVNFLEKQP